MAHPEATHSHLICPTCQSDLSETKELAYFVSAGPSPAPMTTSRRDGWAQRGGIDRLVIPESGKTLWIEEKLRERDYPDILLEYYSDRERKVPGWIAKDLTCDYLAYAFLPSGRCYLLPFQQLRLCWQKHRHEWVRRYGPPIEAQNEGYVSVGVAVPITVLLAALSQMLVVSWTGDRHGSSCASV